MTQLDVFPFKRKWSKLMNLHWTFWHFSVLTFTGLLEIISIRILVCKFMYIKLITHAIQLAFVLLKVKQFSWWNVLEKYFTGDSLAKPGTIFEIIWHCTITFSMLSYLFFLLKQAKYKYSLYLVHIHEHVNKCLEFRTCEKILLAMHVRWVN